jgi:hypothetical protein
MIPTMVALRTYLEGLRAIHSTGEAVEETSYYGQLERLLAAPSQSLDEVNASATDLIAHYLARSAGISVLRYW